MKVLVIGAGAVGGVLCKLLAKEKRVSQIICCDIKEKIFNNKKIIFKKLDISDKNELLKFLKEEKPTIVVNALIPTFNRTILECCLASKVNYIDTASDWEVDPNPKAQSPYKVEQLDYDEAFKTEKILGMINSGVSPGLTNLLAKEASEKLDTIDSIKIRLIEDTRSDKLYFPWCVEWLLDELNWQPLVYRNNKFKKAPKFSEPEEFDFLEPFGRKKVCLVGQEEIGTIPLYIKTKNADLKIYDNQTEVTNFLTKLGLISDNKLKIGDFEISPKKFVAKLLERDKTHLPKKWEVKNAQFGLAVIAEGKKNNKKKEVRYTVAFPKDKDIDKLKIDANFISYPTALMLSLFILIFPKIKKFGVFPPEALGKNVRGEIIKELKKYCNFSFEIK